MLTALGTGRDAPGRGINTADDKAGAVTLLLRAPKTLPDDPSSSFLCMERMLTENERLLHT